ncbi:hypothetical protein GCM10011282_19050 [Undibacterium macrobrachii]|uniref:WD40-like Beta Propeller Repeat n=2 Tax=Undibacterium macrobrachii TaxID=1119058 RepID=A0ABQ2XEI9_9BURK|nr:hypothetical protein GCM10011282_19050 [Undibacterium macrobrachii]
MYTYYFGLNLKAFPYFIFTSMHKSLIAVALYICASAFNFSNAQFADFKTTEKVLGKMIKNRSSNFVVSGDGQRIAYVVGTGRYDAEMGPSESWEKYHLVVDGKVGKPYRRISEVQFSPDSQRVGYISTTAVIIDGKEDQAFGESATDAVNQQIRELYGLRFSADSKSYAYATSSINAEGPAFIVLNGIKLKSYARVHNPLFSPDGKHIAYSAQIANPRRELVILDNKEGPTFDHLIEDDNLKFSPDSSKLTYLAWPKHNKPAQYIMVNNGREHVVLLGGEKWRTFSPDSKHLAYAFETEHKKKTILVDQKIGQLFNAWGLSAPIFSPDSQRIAFVVTTHNPSLRKGQVYTVLDGKSGKVYQELLLQQPIFSADSQHFAYGAFNGTSWMTVVDGIEGTHFNSVRDLQFNPTKEGLAFIAQVGDKFCVSYRGTNGTLFDQVVDLQFSDDGNTLAYAALNSKDKKWRVIINGKESPPYDFILAKDAYDHKTSTPQSQSSLRFISNNQLQFLATRGDRLISVKLQIP